MPSVEEIQQSISGAWALMRGRKSGLGLLDLSADGFWDSFWAIPLSVPPLLLSWISLADALSLASEQSKASLVARLALADIAQWVIPIVLLALLARRIGISNRFVHFIVASNWATTIIVWIGLPIALLGFFVPGSEEIATVLSLGLFVLSLVLFWRLTRTTLETDVPTTIGIYVAVNVVSFIIVITVQALTGVPGATA